MAKTPTQRTMTALRDRGLKPWIVEKWIPAARKRLDMFNIIDIVALDIVGRKIIGVQSCGSAFSEHVNKLTQDKVQECADWLNAGGTLELYGWRKVKVKRGGKAMIWSPRFREFTLADFEDDPLMM